MVMKYVMLEYREDDVVKKVIPVLFAGDIIHADMAEMVSHIRMFSNPSHTKWMWPKVISAGFFDGECCYGKSESLGINSNPNDTEIILQHLS